MTHSIAWPQQTLPLLKNGLASRCEAGTVEGGGMRHMRLHPEQPRKCRGEVSSQAVAIDFDAYCKIGSRYNATPGNTRGFDQLRLGDGQSKLVESDCHLK